MYAGPVALFQYIFELGTIQLLLHTLIEWLPIYANTYIIYAFFANSVCLLIVVAAHFHSGVDHKSSSSVATALPFQFVC